MKLAQRKLEHGDKNLLFRTILKGHKTVRMTLEKYSKYIPHNHVDFGKCFN